jgi:hypothetical protein
MADQTRATTAAGDGRGVDSPGISMYNISAKTVHPVRADFSFQGSSHIIFQRPSVATTGSVFANCPPSGTGGRTILNPRHFRPPKISNKKAAIVE